LKRSLVKESYSLACEKSGQFAFNVINNNELVKECFSICFEKLTSEQKLFLKQDFEFPIFINNC